MSAREKMTARVKRIVSHADFRLFARNFGALLSGNYLSYGLSAVTLAVVPRLLGPNQYGIMSSALAIAGLFGALRLSGFDKALVRDVACDKSRASDEYARVWRLKLWGGSLAAVLCLVTGFFVADSSMELWSVAVLSTLNLTQTATSLELGIVQAFEAMHLIPVVGLARQVAYLVLLIPVLLMWPGSRVAVVACMALVGSYLLAVIMSTRLRRRFLPSPTKRPKHVLDRRFITSGLLFSTSVLFVFLYGRIDILFIDAFLGKVDVGHYNLALSVSEKASGPFAMLVTAMFPTLVRRHSERGTKLSDVVVTSALLFAVASLIAAAVWLLAPLVVTLLAGSEYASSVAPLRALILALPFTVMLHPFIQVLQAMRREDVPVKMAPLRAALNVGLDWFVLERGWGIVGVGWGTVITNLVFGVIFALAASRIISRDGVPS